jgi:outer membrane protein assembly factor BamB
MRCRNSFGEGGSPALAGEHLIVPWDHEDQSKLYALDTKSGEIHWQVDRDEPTTWGTPLVTDAGGRTQVVMNGTQRVRSYDARDGSLIWECGGQAFNPVASPIRFGDLVCCTTGRRGFATSAMPLSATGDITGTDKVAWHRTDSGAYVASPVIYQGRLYHIKGTSAVVSCLDASSGEAVFGPSRLPGLRDIYASPVAAADRVYFSDRKGATVVLKHGDQLDVLATNTLDEGCDASLVLIGNQILLRGSKHLYCIAKP